MPILEANSIVKTYKQSDHVVYAANKVTFKVEENEFIAIIGRSGSGKSTLLSILAGLDTPSAGEVIIRGQNITKMNPDALARFRGENIGFVFQRHNLIPQYTALENILLPTMMCEKPGFKYEEHLKKLIKSLDLGDRLGHLPSELSGGQQQRFAIARALINMPSVLFADEPTGNLDKENADEVLSLLLETRAQIGQTLLMVTHDLSIAERADRIFKMEGGELFLFKDKDGYKRVSYEKEQKI